MYGENVKRFIRFLMAATIGFSLVLAPSAHATDSDEQKVLEMKQHGNGGWIGMTFENVIDDYLPSRINATNGKENNGNNEGLDTILCTSLSDAACKKDGYRIDFRSVLAPCESDDQLDCVQSITAKLPDGTISKGTVARKWNAFSAFAGDPTIGVPTGGAQTTWKIPGSNPGSTEDYALTVIVGGRTGPMTNGVAAKNSYSSLQVNLKPIREVTGNYNEPRSSVGVRGAGRGLFTDTTASERGCVIAELNRCAMAASFNLETQFTVKVRLSVQSSQWMHGRLYDPSVSVDPLSGDAKLLTVTANPLQVPMVAGWVAWKDLPETIKVKYPQGAGGTGADMSDFTTPDLANRIMRVGMRAAGQDALDDFKLWNPLLSDKPMAMRTMWSLRTISNSDPAINACNKDGLSGLVTTNAAVYSDGPPSFDKESQSLNYTVGAPHFDTSSKVFNGTYSLTMNAEVARCIYGFGKAPISAKIEIASEDGTPDVAVTTLSQDGNWMKLSANGFHYSTPQIKVKLTEEKPVVEPAPAPKPALSTAKIVKTISCFKGTSLKKVSAVKPVCPKGYKKA